MKGYSLMISKIRIASFGVAMIVASLATTGSAEAIKLTKPYSAYEFALLHQGLDERKDNAEIRQMFRSVMNSSVNPAETAWCAIWVDVMNVKAGQPAMKTLWARDFLKYGIPTNSPERGDVVVVKRGKINGHVGYFHEMVTDIHGKRWVAILGGNNPTKTSGGISGIAYHPIEDVLGYRKHPKT